MGVHTVIHRRRGYEYTNIWYNAPFRILPYIPLHAPSRPLVPVFSLTLRILIFSDTECTASLQYWGDDQDGGQKQSQGIVEKLAFEHLTDVEAASRSFHSRIHMSWFEAQAFFSFTVTYRLHHEKVVSSDSDHPSGLVSYSSRCES